MQPDDLKVNKYADTHRNLLPYEFLCKTVALKPRTDLIASLLMCFVPKSDKLDFDYAERRTLQITFTQNKNRGMVFKCFRCTVFVYKNLNFRTVRILIYINNDNNITKT